MGMFPSSCVGQADCWAERMERVSPFPAAFTPGLLIPLPATHYAGFLVLSVVSILCMHPSNDSSSSCVTILITTSVSFLLTDKPQRFALVLNVLGCLYFTSVLSRLSSQKQMMCKMPKRLFRISEVISDFLFFNIWYKLLFQPLIHNIIKIQVENYYKTEELMSIINIQLCFLPFLYACFIVMYIIFKLLKKLL